MPRQQVQAVAAIAGAVMAGLALFLVLRFVNAGSEITDANNQRDAHRAALSSLQELALAVADRDTVTNADAGHLGAMAALSLTAQKRLSEAGASAEAAALKTATTDATTDATTRTVGPAGTVAPNIPPAVAHAQAAAERLKATVSTILQVQQRAVAAAGATAHDASSRRTWALRWLILLFLLTGAAAIAWLSRLIPVQGGPGTPEPAAARRRQPLGAPGDDGAAAHPGGFQRSNDVFNQDEPWQASRSPSADPVPLATLPVASAPPRLSSSEPVGAGRAFTMSRAPGGLPAKLAVTTSAHPGTALDAATHNGLVVYAGSMIGPEHRAGKNVVPREDAYSWAPGQDSTVIVVAVADGVGSARNSHAAALMATELAVAQLRVVSSAELEAWYDRPQLWRERSHLLMATIARQLTPRRVDERARLIELATSSSTSAQRPADPATTLVLAIGVISGDGVRVLWASVGDSQVSVLAPGARQLSWTQEEGDSPSGTRALPMDTDHVICSRHFLPQGHAFLLTTDGCEKVLSLDPGTVPLLHEMVRNPGDTGRLLELLHRNPPGAGDDRTLVLFAPAGGVS